MSICIAIYFVHFIVASSLHRAAVKYTLGIKYLRALQSMKAECWYNNILRDSPTFSFVSFRTNLNVKCNAGWSKNMFVWSSWRIISTFSIIKLSIQKLTINSHHVSVYHRNVVPYKAIILLLIKLNLLNIVNNNLTRNLTYRQQVY